jgi:hypothetical protein
MIGWWSWGEGVYLMPRVRVIEPEDRKDEKRARAKAN